MYYRELAHLSWYNMRRVTMARRGKMSHDAAPSMGTLYFHPSALLVGLTRKCTCASALWLVAASGIIDLCFSTQHQIVFCRGFRVAAPDTWQLLTTVPHVPDFPGPVFGFVPLCFVSFEMRHACQSRTASDGTCSRRVLR